MPAKPPARTAAVLFTGCGHCLALVASLLLGVAARAQTAPDAGQLLRDAQPLQRPVPRDDAAALPSPPTARPELALPTGLKVHVNAIRVTGAQTQPVDKLDALVADAPGHDFDFAGLQALADRITAYYRRQGYVLARAYLPAQQIDRGIVEIAVIEGRLGRINLTAEPPLPRDALAARLKRLQADQPLRTDALEGDLLSLSDLPGVRVQSVLRPGQAVGTSDLDIEVLPGDRVNGSLSADNYGNRFSGANRLSGRVGVANPLFFGDALDATFVYGGSGFAYGRLAWQAPVAATGWQVGLAQSDMSYRLGKQFESLEARGNASDTTLYAVQSLVRSRVTQLDLNLAYDRKHFDDASLSGSSAKRADVVSASLGGRTQWEGGLTSGSVAVTAGRLDLDAANAENDAQGHRTAGSYAKVNFQVTHDQAFGSAGLSARLSGQFAGKNLDSSEKFALGGVQAVRAYPQGEASSDEAVMLNLEGYRNFDGWRAKVFADAAAGRTWHDPLPGENHNLNRRSGVGVGVDAALPGQFVLQAVVAWRTARAPTSDTDRRPRAWLQVSRSF